MSHATSESTLTPSLNETGCCPRFHPETLHEKEISWVDKPFVREHVHNLFHVPLDMGHKVTHAMRLIEASHATAAQGLMLTEELSPWRSDLYIDVNGPVKGAEMVTISGTFLTRVYEGPFRDTPTWFKDMEAYVASKGRTLERIYLAYTTCPACAKAYGKNYVVLFAKVLPLIEMKD